jgi:hypothetical protein
LKFQKAKGIKVATKTRIDVKMKINFCFEPELRKPGKRKIEKGIIIVSLVESNNPKIIAIARGCD